jgi:uncharacterized SAM-binding protein YcdF (DUF218 family)
LLVEKSLLERAGLFNETLPAAEDTLLIFNLSFFSGFFYLAEPLVTIRLGAANSLTRDVNLAAAKRRYHGYLRVQSEMFARLQEVMPQKTVIVRERMAYFSSCRAELACAEGNFPQARSFARGGIFGGGGFRVALRCAAILCAPKIAAVWCRKKWPARNSSTVTGSSAPGTVSPPAARPPLFFARRLRWGLTGRGWLAVGSFVLLAAVLWVLNIRSFLAPTRRVNTGVLVVEGWVHEYSIRAAVREFQAGHYEKVYTTGGPIVGTGGYSNDYNTSASVGAEMLVADGLPRDLVQMVPSHISGRDRTYSSALKLREYFQTNGLTVKSFNVLTEDVHARRTRMLFQKAFGPDTAVGIIAVPDPEYDPARWWHYSEGVREILGESIAWCYAEFIFRPEKR